MEKKRMEKRVRNRFMALFALFFVLISLCSALTASIDKPKMVLYENISEGSELEFEQSVIVNNNNDYEIEIFIEPTGDWKNRIEISGPKFSLPAGDRKEVFYAVKIDKAGSYNGDIIVKFVDNKAKTQVSLAQELIVHVKGYGDSGITGRAVDGAEKGSSKIAVFIIAGIFLIVAFVIFWIMITKTKRNVKYENE